MTDDYSITEYKVKTRLVRIHRDPPPIPEPPEGYSYYASRVFDGIIPCVQVCIFVYEPSSLFKIAKAALTRWKKGDDTVGGMRRLERELKRQEALEELVALCEESHDPHS